MYGTMEAPERPDAVEPRASDLSRPGPAFGCREGVFQTTLFGEYPINILNPDPDTPPPDSSANDSDSESTAEPVDAAVQPMEALALQWNICVLSTRHAELKLLINILRMPVHLKNRRKNHAQGQTEQTPRPAPQPSRSSR